MSETDGVVKIGDVEADSAIFLYICAFETEREFYDSGWGPIGESGDIQVILRKVDKGSPVRALANIAHSDSELMIIGTYADGITHEIELRLRNYSKQHASHVAFAIFQCLKASSPGEAFSFISTSHSWNDVSNCKPDQIKITHSFARPTLGTLQLRKPKPVTTDGFDWACTFWPRLLLLSSGSSEFKFAAEIYFHYMMSDSPRLTVINLWSAIEAIFNIDRELRNGLALHAACFLRARGPERERLFAEVKKMYDVRSAIVHGRKVEMEKIVAHTVQTRNLLGEIICKTIDSNIVPDTRSIFLSDGGHDVS